MATENDPNKKETPAEKPTGSAEAKPPETGKSDASPSSASDKLNDAAKSAGAIAGSLFTKAKGLADEAIKTAKSDETKQNLNNAAKSAGDLASKVFAKAKDAAADVKKELGNVNDLRKESFANNEVGTSKKEMAKGFWAKLSGKQKGILAGILAIFVYFSYSVLFSSDKQKVTVLATPAVNASGAKPPTFPESLAVNKDIGGCVAVVRWRSRNGKELSPELRAVAAKYQPLIDFVIPKLAVCASDDKVNDDCAKKTLSPQELALSVGIGEATLIVNRPQSPNEMPLYETASVAYCSSLMK